MALHRLQAAIRYSAASGLAGWSKAQMDVRFQQAVHINPGLPNEEAPVNEVEADGTDEIFRCDLPLMDEAAAIDAMNTLSAASVWTQAKALTANQESWIQHHTCHHDANPPQP